ncbi:MAG: hypothetical protein AB1595_06780, partial [bacterium]
MFRVYQEKMGIRRRLRFIIALFESLRIIGLLISPIMPEKAEKILSSLGNLPLKRGWKAFTRYKGLSFRPFIYQKIMRTTILSLLFLSFSAMADIKLARSYFTRWQFEKARSAYLEELKRTNNPEILFPLVVCYQKEGKLSSFKKLKFFPHLRDGLFFYYKGDYKRAYRAFKRDKTLYSYVGMGICKKAEGDFRKAENLFLKAKQTSLGCINLFNLYQLLGNNEELQIKTLKEGIKKIGSNEILLNLARLLISKEMFSPALNILHKLELDEPKNILIKEEIIKALLFKEGHIHFHGQVALMNKIISSLVIKEEVDRLYLKGYYKLLIDAYIPASIQFEDCIKKDPDFLRAKINDLWVRKETRILGWKTNELYKEVSGILPGDG